MLYVFAGVPKTGLNSGGLRKFVEDEDIGILEEDVSLQYRKEGVFILGKKGEELKSPITWHISTLCLLDGITWKWFSDNWSFGNGVTVHKTTAIPEYKTVVNGGNFSLDEFLSLNGPARLAELELQRKLERTEGWVEWEKRWPTGMCPLEAVVVQLTWLIFKDPLPNHAYWKLRECIEIPGYQLSHPELYTNDNEPTQYLSPTRTLTFRGSNN